LTPFFLIPGFSCTDAVFQHTASSLWPYGPVTIANPAEGTTVTEAAKALLAQAPPQFALLGFSMGGYIALEMVRQAPGRVTKLCMLSSMARPDNEMERAARQDNIDFVKSHPFPESLEKYFPSSTPDDRGRDAEFRALHRQMAAQIGQETYIRHFEMIRDRPDSRPDLAGMTLPVAIIVGDRDCVCTPEDGREMAALFPNATVHLIADAGHFALLEQPEAVGKALAAWATM